MDAEVRRFVQLAREKEKLHVSELPREALAFLREEKRAGRGLPEAFRGCYFLLDEFQDTDAVQAQLVLELAADDDSCRLTLVGDADQAECRCSHATPRRSFPALRSCAQRTPNAGIPPLCLGVGTE